MLILGIRYVVIIWSRAPEYRPLIQDMRLVNAVKIVDVLDVKEIPYKADIKNHIWYVDVLHQTNKASLAKVGFVLIIQIKMHLVQYHKHVPYLKHKKQENRPIHQTEWFSD